MNTILCFCGLTPFTAGQIPTLFHYYKGNEFEEIGETRESDNSEYTVAVHHTSSSLYK